MDAPTRIRSALTALVRHEAAPELLTLGLVRARIVTQRSDGRVSLQLVDRSGELPDTLPVPIWPGVPGVSADHKPGQEVLLAFAGADPSDPVAFVATPRGQPGFVPLQVRHEATDEIRFVRESAGIVRVGAETVPVALAPAVQAIIDALEAFAGTLTGSTDPVVASAGEHLQAGITGLTVAATRLEAE